MEAQGEKKNNTFNLKGHSKSQQSGGTNCTKRVPFQGRKYGDNLPILTSLVRFNKEQNIIFLMSGLLMKIPVEEQTHDLISS